MTQKNAAPIDRPPTQAQIRRLNERIVEARGVLCSRACGRETMPAKVEAAKKLLKEWEEKQHAAASDEFAAISATVKAVQDAVLFAPTARQALAAVEGLEAAAAVAVARAKAAK